MPYWIRLTLHGYGAIMNKRDFLLKTLSDLLSLKSSKSHDTNRRVGAAIVDLADMSIINMAFNTYTDEVYSALDTSKFSRKEKLFYIEHAERNAIYDAHRTGKLSNRAINDITIITTNFPCCDCMRAIVLSGIKTIAYVIDEEFEQSDNWLDNIEASRNIAKLHDIKLVGLIIDK